MTLVNMFDHNNLPEICADHSDWAKEFQEYQSYLDRLLKIGLFDSTLFEAVRQHLKEMVSLSERILHSIVIHRDANKKIKNLHLRIGILNQRIQEIAISPRPDADKISDAWSKMKKLQEQIPLWANHKLIQEDFLLSAFTKFSLILAPSETASLTPRGDFSKTEKSEFKNFVSSRGNAIRYLFFGASEMREGEFGGRDMRNSIVHSDERSDQHVFIGGNRFIINREFDSERFAGEKKGVEELIKGIDLEQAKVEDYDLNGIYVEYLKIQKDLTRIGFVVDRVYRHLPASIDGVCGE